MRYNYILPMKWKTDCITVVYDKGRDNDATLKSKLISAFRKTRTDTKLIGEYIQKLKKNKSVNVYY
mgnify:CR=1 FL=1